MVACALWALPGRNTLNFLFRKKTTKFAQTQKSQYLLDNENI